MISLMRIHPDIKDPQLLRLFHMGSRVNWTSLDYPSFLPEGWDREAARSLARLISPVYLGEQSAMLGANRAITVFSASNETSYVVYLATFMNDEARHLEALTRLYEQVELEPAGIRELPDMLRYHHRMRGSGNIISWVTGILVSDIFARHFYRLLSEVYEKTPLGDMARRVIVDEGRHQAFAVHYLTAALPHVDEDEHRFLWDVKEDLLAIVGRLGVALDEDARRLGIDGKELFDGFAEDVDRHCRKVGLTSRCRLCPENGSCAPAWSELSGKGCACDLLVAGKASEDGEGGQDGEPSET